MPIIFRQRSGAPFVGSSAPAPGYDGTIRVGTGSNSNKLVNATGAVVQLRGAVMTNLEDVAIQQYDPSNPWGAQPPTWSVYATWKPNAVRIGLNAASWLGLTVYNTASATTWGSSINADPGGNYKATVIAAVAAAQAIGCYVILDLHWSAPKLTLGGVTYYLAPQGQSPFADVDTSVPFWTSIAGYFGTQATPQAGINNNGILFELFNEPFLDNFTSTLSAGSPDLALKNGGTCSAFPNYPPGEASNYSIAATWNIASHAAMISAVRATGAQNVCIVSGNSWAQELENYANWKPTDSAGQLAFGWHPYPNGTYPYSDGDVYGKIGSDAGSGTSSAVQWANAIIAAGYPVIITEDGGSAGPSATSGEPHISYMQSWADSAGASGYLLWQWNRPLATGTNGANVETTGTITAPTPSLGQGQTNYNWMTAHAT